jgi:hypothetical protein
MIRLVRLDGQRLYYRRMTVKTETLTKTGSMPATNWEW